MRKILQEFDDSIKLVREQTDFYDYLVNNLRLPHVYSTEILRSQLVCAVSAMDRFFHEIVRMGFIESYRGIRKQSAKFKNWQFSNETVLSLLRFSDSAFVPSSIQETPEYLIEQDVVHKLSIVAYQHPDKIKDALSYVCEEPHKMQTIAVLMGFKPADGQKLLEQKLKLICERRNQIVHEGDIESSTRLRRNINQLDINDNIDFIERFCHNVFQLITKPNCYVVPAPIP